jgi:signal transduction histidine kinase
MIVAGSIVVTVVVPALIAVTTAAPTAWSDRSFVLSVLASIGVVILLAIVTGRAASRAVLRPLVATAERLEAVARGELPATVKEPGATEIARIERTVLAIVEAAWARERRYATAVGALAHDVRLSLAAVKGAIQNPPGPDSMTSVTLSGTVAAEVACELARLQTMTSDLVVLMRPLRQDVADEGVSIGFIVGEVSRAVGMSTAHAIDVKVTKEFSRALPRSLLERLFRNLLENAARAARSRVAIEVLEGLVVVADDGPGLPGHMYRADEQQRPSPARGDAHHGFGFEIACRLAELCGGKIVVERATATGTTILVYI